jgi:outer membrane protein OmpA-like peptidoglycan-associated protein
MRDQILKNVRRLAAFMPLLVLAQPVAAQRVRSWEFSVGGGAMYTDGALANFLGVNGFSDDGSTPSRFMPALAVRLGYNTSHHWGFSIGTAGGRASGVKYLTPFAAATYTANLNARFSPFITGGTQFTRITGNGRKVHPTWGTHLGVGIRSMLGDRVALRLEGRLGIEHYAELPGAKTAYNSIATLGLSYFTAGRSAPPPAAMAAAPCPVCPRARVDTVWRTPPPAAPPPAIVLRDTLVLEGVDFDFDSSALTPASHRILDHVAQLLLERQWANTRWEIAGHTSGIGTPEYNMALSQRRAEAVRAYLVSRGVPDNRLTPRGYGEANPMYPNDTEGRNWRNRRVELRRMWP